MTPPSPAWRDWFYAVSWMGAAVASTALLVWLVKLVRWDWPASAAEQQLAIIGNALYGVVGIMALVTLGLTMRNAIRAFKATGPGGLSLTADGQIDEQGVISITAEATGPTGATATVEGKSDAP